MDNPKGGETSNLLPLLGKVGWSAFLLALVLAPLIGGSPPGATYGADVPLSALRALVVLAALCTAVTGESAGDAAREKGNAPPALAAVGAAFALTLVSLLVHSWFLTSPVLLFAQVPATLDWLCFALAATMSVEWTRRDRRNLVWIVGAVGTGAGLSAVWGVWEHFTGVAGTRASGPFFDPNFLAGMLALGLPLLVAGLFAARKSSIAVGLGLAAGVAIAALAATGSRAGFGIGIVAAAITVGAASLMDARLCKRRVALLIVGGLAFAWAFRGPLTARVEAGASAAASAGGDHSSRFRKETWRGTVAMAKANPLLGTGPGTFPYRYPPYAVVEKSGLAHESYLQMAAEQGFPALAAALAALGLALIALAGTLLRARRDGVGASADDSSALSRTEAILLCGVLGALLAGIVRSAADSEWSILGNALPFWAVAGLSLFRPMAVTIGERSRADARPTPTIAPPAPPRRAVYALLLLPPLGVALLGLHNAQTVDAVKAQFEQHRTPDMTTAAAVWPPDPDLLYWTGHPKEAAAVEPSAVRFYRLGSAEAQSGDLAAALSDYAEATRRDPNNLQAWRTLAETEEKAGDADAALAAWRELIRRYEGPSGRILAIPELPETHPAFAYAALAGAAAHAPSQTDAARDLYEKAAAVIERYSQTSPTYLQMEKVSAAMRGSDVVTRRTQIRDLYDHVTKALAKLPATTPAQAAAFQARRTETLTRLDKIVGEAAQSTIH